MTLQDRGPRQFSRLWIAFASLLLVACSNNQMRINSFDTAVERIDAPAIELAEVRDNRDVPGSVLGSAERGGRAIELTTNQPVVDIVRETLMSALESSVLGDGRRVRVSIQRLRVEHANRSDAPDIIVEARLEFEVLEPVELHAMVPTTATVSAEGTGDPGDEIATAVVEAIAVCARRFVNQLQGLADESDPGSWPARRRDPLDRRTTAEFGFGFAFGSAGLSLEHEIGKARTFALVGGIGVFIGELGSTGQYESLLSWSAGLRMYSKPGRNRVFLHLLCGPVGWYGRLDASSGDFDVERTDYGGAVGGGYRFKAHNGFTIPIGIDLIWSPKNADWSETSQLSFGLGYSW